MEDGAELSGAGQYLSLICDAQAETFSESFSKVWGSLLQVPNSLVIVQEYLSPEFSGVCFCQNGEGLSQIEYIEGGWAGLTHDQISASRIVFDTNGKVYENSKGVNTALIPKLLQEELIESCLRVSLWSTRGRDIEWVISEGMLFFVQNRPITRPVLPTPRSQKWGSLPVQTEYRGGIEALRDFFTKTLGVSTEEVVFDVGGWALPSLMNEWCSEQVLSEFAPKLYILFWRELCSTYFTDGVKDLRFRDFDLQEGFETLCWGLFLQVSLAARPPLDDTYRVELNEATGCYFLSRDLPAEYFLYEKSLQEGVAQIAPLEGLTYTKSENLDKLTAPRFAYLPENMLPSQGKKYVIGGFDIFFRGDSTEHVGLIILERENRLSHWAIRARELEIPCIYWVRWLAKSLFPECQIEIDILSKKVTILPLISPLSAIHHVQTPL
jgi:PEP-utilising enzyme, mobile domain